MKKINRYSAGFTLIELMVGMVLSGMFIGGMAQVFVNTSKTFRTQKTLSNMMEDARFSLDKMNSEFRRAGFLTNREVPDWDRATIYHNRIAVDYDAGVYDIRNDGDTTAGNVLTMRTNEAIRGATNVGGLGSDTVIIRYQLSSGAEMADNQYSPCTDGFAVDLGAGELNTDRYVVVIIFYMEANATVGSNVLFCKAFRENLDTGDTQQLAAVQLISNVERLRVLYGQTDAVAPVPATSTVYRTHAQVNASAVAPATNWDKVRSVRISLALRSEEQNVSIATPGNYIINGKLSVAPTDATEKRLYRVFSTAVAFRNELL